jgi:phage terminase small subunit
MAERQRLAKGTCAAAPPEKKDPLTYMLDVMNDPNAPADRRDKMAIVAAKYVHRRANGNNGKKDDQKAAAKKAVTGRFSMGQAPSKVVDIKERRDEL